MPRARMQIPGMKNYTAIWLTKIATCDRLG